MVVAGAGGLVGRDQELDRLFALVDEVALGGGALVVRGEPGIGKSALLAAAGERAGERGTTVVTTTGTPSEARLAFGGLHRLLLPFLDRVGHRPDPQRRALDVAFGVAEGDAPDLFLIGLATLGVITERQAQTPLLLVVEDAHWLDRSSAEVLAFVARRLEMEPVILLFAERDGVPSALDEAGLPGLTLAGLDDEAARTLIDVSAAGLAEDVKGRILAEAAGNPLALIELPASVDRGPARAWEPLPLTTRLEAAFATRLTDLDADVRALVLLAALDDGKLAELNSAAEQLLGPRYDAGHWTTAAAAGLGTLDDGGFRFRHPLIRSAVYQAATGEQRRLAHAALARALAGDPDRAVWHRAAAAREPDEEIASALDAAADRAADRGGLDTAFAALERAAGLTADPRLLAMRLGRAGNLANQLGRSAEAVRLLRAALENGRLPDSQAALAAFDLETLTLIRRLLSEWTDTATAIGAPHLEVQVAYAAALLADDETAERRFQAAMTAGAAGWPFYAACLKWAAWPRSRRTTSGSPSSRCGWTPIAPATWTSRTTWAGGDCCWRGT